MLSANRPKLAFCVAALLATIPLSVAYAQADDATDMAGTVSIGGLLPLTGDRSSVGAHLKAAAELAVADFNEYLSEQGAEWRLEMIFEDSATNPVMALDKFQLLHSHGIEVVVGPFTSASIQSVKGYADTSGMLAISPGSNAPALAIPDDSIYRMVPDANNQGKAMGKLLEAHGIRALVPMWRGDVYGDGLRDAVAKNFESRGGFVHEGVRYHPDPHELSLEASILADAVQEMVDRYGAERVAVFLIAFDEFLPILQSASNYEVLTQVRWLGGQPIAGQGPLVTDAIASEFAGQVDFAALQLLIGPGSRYGDVSSRLTTLLGTAPSTYSYPIYDSVWVAGMSIIESGSAAAADVKAVLPDVAAAHDGVIASNELNDAGDLVVANYQIWRVTDGTWDIGGKYSSVRDFLTAETGPSGTVEVGVVYPLTGGSGSASSEELAATQLGADDFNAFLRGMDAGWELALAIEDAGADPATALEKVRTLHSRGIGIILGPDTSSRTAQIKPYADANDMMLVSCCSTAPSLAIPGDSVFRLFLDDSKQGAAMGKLLESEGIGAVVPIWRGDIYGDDLVESVRNNFESRGGTVAGGVRYNPDAVELASEVSALAEDVQAMANKHGTDRVAVFMVSFGESGQIVREAANHDILDDIRWFGSESLTKGAALTEEGAAREFASKVGFTSMQIAEDRGDVYERVRSHLLEKHGRDPTAFAYQAYDIAWLVGLSILQAGSADAASAKSVFHDVAADYDGTLGPTTLNEAGDLVSAYYDIWQVTGDGWTETGRYSLLRDAIVAKEPAEPITVNGTGFAPDFYIGGGDVHAMSTNPQESTLIIEMMATKAGSLEITLPRALIDSRSAGDADGPLFVLVDGLAAPFEETNADDRSRTLQIDFDAGSETIEVVGTWVTVPEFGMVAALVLAAATALIVAIPARSRLGAVSGY